MPVDGKGARGGDVMTKTHAMGSGVSYGMRYLLRMIFNLAIDYDDDGNAAGGGAKLERPRTVVHAPKHALKRGGIAERAITKRYEQAVRSAGPSQPFPASEAGRAFSPRFRAQAAGYDELNPPPHDMVPDGATEAARALNRRLHPINDELPVHSASPKLDYTEKDGVPAFLDRRQTNGTADDAGEPSYLALVGR
jgi:hypothetical protein